MLADFRNLGECLVHEFSASARGLLGNRGRLGLTVPGLGLDRGSVRGWGLHRPSGRGCSEKVLDGLKQHREGGIRLDQVPSQTCRSDVLGQFTHACV